MSVIGKLDEQVEAILIAPLGRKREQGETTDAADAPENIARADALAQTPDENERSEKSEAKSEELPVWLL